jgi:methyl-accepting chemotaxis protein
MAMLARLKITARINLILVLAVIGIVLIAAIGFSILRAQMGEERRGQLRNLLDLTLSIARADMKAAGGPETEAGRKAFFAVLQSTRFGDAKEVNYIFAHDYNGVVTSLDDPKKIGQSRLEVADTDGFKFVKEFIKVAKGPAGAGFVTYKREKGIGGAITPKLSLIQNVPELGGYVGVGVYLDDMDRAFFQRLVTGLWQDERLLLLLFFLIAGVSFLIGYSLIRSIRSGLSVANSVVDAVAKGDFSKEIDVTRRDEIGQLLRHAADMTQVLKSFGAAQLEMARQHNEYGQINRTIEETKFAGAYRDMARNVNEMVKSHIDVQRQFVDRMVEYANGDFANRVAVLPGERKAISDTAERLRGALMQAEAEAKDTLKIKIALDNASSCLMMADAEGVIRYQNKASDALMRKSEGKFRSVLPSFSAGSVLGGHFDQFHKNPGRQLSLLANLTGEHRTQIQIGGLHMRLIANPIMDKEGERLGSVVEWLDRTAETQAELEMSEVVEAAAAGNFSKRITETDKLGFMLQIAQGLNKVLATSESGLAEIGRILKALANGDLTQSIEGEFKGVFAELKENSNSTIKQLQEIIAQIRETSNSIDTAAREIAAGNNNLSHRTEEQASSLEETASSIEELASTVKRNAENAQMANRLASEASKSAERGGEVVGQVVATMAGITESNKEIADITALIDGIAFQTNLLALNAAVEAARAGENGRGFAVVASEVRTLAQRAADAARDIKAVIAASAGKMEDGAKLVKSAGAAMDAIVAEVQRVNAIIGEIAAACSEQSIGISEVNQAITSIDRITQQNAALVEEATAAAKSFEDQSANLMQAVAVFKVETARGCATPKGGQANDSAARTQRNAAVH